MLFDLLIVDITIWQDTPTNPNQYTIPMSEFTFISDFLGISTFTHLPEFLQVHEIVYRMYKRELATDDFYARTLYGIEIPDDAHSIAFKLRWSEELKTTIALH